MMTKKDYLEEARESIKAAVDTSDGFTVPELLSLANAEALLAIESRLASIERTLIVHT